jgi:dienelactone hydrolase
MSAFGRTAELIKYTSGRYLLPGYLYKPSGVGPYRVIIWNHGSERDPSVQPELAKFYTQNGYAVFLPIRQGHGKAPGIYIGAREAELRTNEHDASLMRTKLMALHELYNQDVVAAVAWLKEQRFAKAEALVMSGVSYGGIQTLLTAEKGLGIRAFVPFSPGAMSWGNPLLRERLATAARRAKAPVFLLQAQNDFSTGPSDVLGPLLKAKGSPNDAKLYPAFGTTNQQGHAAFACWSLGAMTWGEDVLTFLDAALGSAESADDAK